MVVAAENGKLTIDNEHFGMNAGAFSCECGIEVLHFECLDDSDVVSQRIALEEIAVKKQTYFDSPVGSLAKGIEKMIDRVAGFAAVVAGCKEEDIDGF